MEPSEITAQFVDATFKIHASSTGILNRQARSRKSNEASRAESQRAQRNRKPLKTEEILLIKISNIFG
jgi:hypothetical protein